MGQNVSMKITSVTGHMMGLEFDARYKNWQGVNPEQLFTAEVSIPWCMSQESLFSFFKFYFDTCWW